MELKLAASVLSADFGNLEKEIEYAEEKGASIIHWDVMDGHFVPNITFGPTVIQALRDKTELLFSTHLMIENPDNFIEEFVKAGSDILFVHAEACPDLQRTILRIKDFGVEAGVALSPETPVVTIEDVLGDIDFVLVMTVTPGFGGQEFLPGSLSKIKEARQMVESRDLDIDIGVDGGVNEKTVQSVLDAGANVLVVGSAFYEKEKEFSIRNLTK